MNPRTRKAALYAIAVIAILASANALAHSYAGLYDWAVHHRLTGWQAKSWPAEIDVFLAVGELALYVAYLDAWPARQRIWPWATALTGLAVSVAGNIGHIQAHPGHPVILADRLTAATSPLAAFAGLSVGLLVLKMTRQHTAAPPRPHGRPHRARDGPFARPCRVAHRTDVRHEQARVPLSLTRGCSATRLSSFRTLAPMASASASVVSPVNCAAAAIISPTIGSARSRNLSGSPASRPHEPTANHQGRI